ncbi:MAG: hypothetical protein WBC44_08230 [Planctomycetaceae bacterium]
MVVTNNITRAAMLVAAFAVGATARSADWPDAAPASTAGVVTVGYSTCDDACTVGGHCAPGASSVHGYRCNCAECRDQSAFERLCETLKIKKRETLHDHSTWAIDHYRHLHHPKCPPYCHPSWGYYQTCWRRFPEHTLWCPECPGETGPVMPLPAPAVVPVGPAVAPPPAPAAAPGPAPAPMPKAPAVEQPPYEEPASEEPPAESSSVRPMANSSAVQYASIGNFTPPPAAEEPPFLTPVRVQSADQFERPVHPSNRWRMEQ